MNSYWKREMWTAGLWLAVLGGILTGAVIGSTASGLLVPSGAFTPAMLGVGVAYVLGLLSLDLDMPLGWVAAAFELAARMFEIVLATGLGVVVAALVVLFLL